MRMDRDRLVRDLTFWLRPDFVARCLRRFQAIEGFDRAIALASVTFTALIPLGIVTGSFLGENQTASARIVSRFDLTGSGAKAVEDLFDASADIDSSFSMFGVFLLLVALLSFSRAVQRLFERTWELAPLSVRNTKNGIVWIGGLVVYSTAAGIARTHFDDGIMEIVVGVVLLPVGAFFIVWSGRLLTDGRVSTGQLLPGAILLAVLLAVFAIGSDLYVPRLFNSYAGRYGAIGGVFAMISWLFAAMVVVVAGTAVGREIWAEREAIRRGDHPSNAQIEAEWVAVREQVELGRREVKQRTSAARAWVARRRGRSRGG